MGANSTTGCCTGHTNSLCTESRKRDKTAGQKPSKSTRKSLLTGFFIGPLLLLGMLLGGAAGFYNLYIQVVLRPHEKQGREESDED